MKKSKTNFICAECAFESPKWLGKCPRCDSWNSLQEELKAPKAQKSLKEEKAMRPTEIELIEFEKSPTGSSEFDRVLSGGITSGSLTLIGGEPGIGKSTLLMEVCKGLTSQYDDEKVLYVSGEESMAQVAGRAKRLGIDSQNFYILNSSSWQSIEACSKKTRPKLLIIDSIQTTQSDELQAAPGSVSQVREVTYEAMNYAKSSGVSVIIVGHVTKDGAVAGPKLLEHMVDTTLYFEGDGQGPHRALRCLKNRFGTTGEVGIFEMKEEGLKSVENPSNYFMQIGEEESFGRALTCVLEGNRPIFLEAQALVVENKYGNGRRTTQGFDGNRLALLTAVCEKYFNIPLSSHDLYLNIAGGFHLKGREGDLAVLAGLLSSYYSKALPNKTLFLGEVGLTGSVRPAGLSEKRIKEAKLLGFKRVYVSKQTRDELGPSTDIEIIGLSSARDLKASLF